MSSDILLTPTPKRNPAFQRKYPFPIVLPSDCERTDGRWSNIIAVLKDGCISVSDEQSIRLLYSMGFYGTSSISKGVPEACAMYVNKKDDRKKGKMKYQQKRGETSKKRHQEVVKEKESDEDIEVVDSDEPETKKRKLSSDVEVVDTQSSGSSSDDDDTDTEDYDDTSMQVEVEVHEELQLMFEEAFFLSFGLGCLVVKVNDQPLDLIRLWDKLCELFPESNFPVFYTAYHHFRSKGWIVKSGLKYGADYVLYKDGPPFYHSTYAVLVKGVKENKLKVLNKNAALTWSSLAALNRINSHAAKGVMILYVIKPEVTSENKICTPFCVSQYKIQEVLVKRWVPSEGREENT